jgi:MFS family permease
MMMPVARLALLRAYPRSELLPVLNFVTMPGLVGPILGPVLGGVLVTWASWHWIFLINIPIGIIGICMPANICRISPRHGAASTRSVLSCLA